MSAHVRLSHFLKLVQAYSLAKCACDFWPRFWRCYYFQVASQHLGPTLHAHPLSAKPLNLIRGSVRAHLATKVAGFKPLYLGTNASPVANLVKIVPTDRYPEMRTLSDF